MKKSLHKQKLIAAFTILSVLYIQNQAHSAGVVARRQQMMAQQQAMQQAAYQQAMQQQAAQQQAAYNQAIQQRAAQQQAMQQAVQMQAMQQQAMQQAAYQQALAQQQLQRRIVQEMPTTGWGNADSQTNSLPKADLQPNQITTLEAVWDQMAENSNVWSQMVDREPKEITVKRYIELFAQQGVYIRKSAGYYVDMIDNMAKSNPDMLNNPFRDLLRIVSILEYDFDNGQDREELVKQVLGQKGYERNLERVRNSNSKIVY
jgi:tRNA(Glu) U13 pseudouridine synthase TruD